MFDLLGTPIVTPPQNQPKQTPVATQISQFQYQMPVGAQQALGSAAGSRGSGKQNKEGSNLDAFSDLF